MELVQALKGSCDMIRTPVTAAKLLQWGFISSCHPGQAGGWTTRAGDVCKMFAPARGRGSASTPAPPARTDIRDPCRTQMPGVQDGFPLSSAKTGWPRLTEEGSAKTDPATRLHPFLCSGTAVQVQVQAAARRAKGPGGSSMGPGGRMLGQGWGHRARQGDQVTAPLSLPITRASAYTRQSYGVMRSGSWARAGKAAPGAGAQEGTCWSVHRGWRKRQGRDGRGVALHV